MLCELEKSQLNIAAELYAKAYNVNSVAANAILENFADLIFAQKENDKVLAILCVSKFSIDNNNAVLLHGAALADEKYQNELNALVNHAKVVYKADNCFIALTDKLETHAKQHDMVNTISARLLTRDIKRNLWAKADFDTITAKKLIQLREKYVKEGYPKLSLQQTSALMTFLYSQGISSAQTDKAYALYFRTSDNLTVAELYAQTDVDAWLLLEAMANHEGRNTAQLILSEHNTIFAGEGKRFDYASYSGCEIKSNNIYIGPMPK